jgi:hypothetical protein
VILSGPLAMIIPMRPSLRVIRAFPLIALAALAVLAVAGACLGPSRARALLTSWPAAALWIALAFGLVVAMGADLLARRIALALAHGGAVVILIGSFLAGSAGHALLAQLGRPTVYRGMVEVGARPREEQLSVCDSEGQVIGTLAAQVRLVDYDPLAAGPWILAIERISDGTWEQAVLDPTCRTPQQVGGMTITIGEMVPATYAAGEFATPPSFAFRVERGEVHRDGRFIAAAPDCGLGVSLQELFVSESDPTGQAGWRAAGSPSLVMDPPWGLYVMGVRLGVSVEGEPEQVADLTANQPMRIGGHHVYWTGLAGRGAVVLTVVSARGWLAIRVGIVLMLIGLVGHCWVGPIRQQLKRGRST